MSLRFRFGIISDPHIALPHTIWDSPHRFHLVEVSIQFPDPWFKKRHQKRRVVQPELVAELAEFLPVGGLVRIAVAEFLIVVGEFL
ncbi:hypothetical protein [Leptolyngbya ohadii]|uniref:hypothetical protein n=1 Tax=Leptolyngbya ohadii TaxID=1962290 RepID=UPI000B599246